MSKVMNDLTLLALNVGGAVRMCSQEDPSVFSDRRASALWCSMQSRREAHFGSVAFDTGGDECRGPAAI